MKYLHELVMEDMPKEAQVILPELETLDFIRQGKKPGPVPGNPGTGKTHIATALGIKACPTGLYRIVYFSAGPAYPDKEAKISKDTEDATIKVLKIRSGHL